MPGQNNVEIAISVKDELTSKLHAAQQETERFQKTLKEGSGPAGGVSTAGIGLRGIAESLLGISFTAAGAVAAFKAINDAAVESQRTINKTQTTLALYGPAAQQNIAALKPLFGQIAQWTASTEDQVMNMTTAILQAGEGATVSADQVKAAFALQHIYGVSAGAAAQAVGQYNIGNLQPMAGIVGQRGATAPDLLRQLIAQNQYTEGEELGGALRRTWNWLANAATLNPSAFGGGAAVNITINNPVVQNDIQQQQMIDQIKQQLQESSRRGLGAVYGEDQ